MKYQYKYYKTDGSTEVIKRNKLLSLEEMQELVGGYIEQLALKNGNVIMVNEEGFLKALPNNPHFTQDDVYASLEHTGGYLLGNIIEGRIDKDYEFIGVE